MSKVKGMSCAKTAMLMLFGAWAFACSLRAEEVIITEGGYRWWFNVNNKEVTLTRFCFYNSTPSTVSPDVTIPAVVNGRPVTKIGSAFGGYSWYDNDKGKYVSGEAVRRVIVPETVTEIGEKAFCGCEDLVSVTIPSLVSRIGSYAFNGCNKLAGIQLPSLLKVIDSYTFTGCAKLTEIQLPNSLTVIGKSAFERAGLKSIALPNGLVEIYECAFAGTALKTITIPSTVSLIGGYAFSGTQITTLTFDGCRPETFIWPLDNRYDNYEDTSSPWATNKPLPFGGIKAYPWNMSSFSGYKYVYSYHENVKVKWFPDHSGYEVLEDKTVYGEFKPTLEYRTDEVDLTIIPADGAVLAGRTYIEIKAVHPDIEILYTMNGADPTLYGKTYTSPIKVEIDGEITIRAVGKFKGSVCTRMLEAHYYQDPDVKSCTISFDPKGGSLVSDVQIKKGDTIDELPSTNREGYIFEGWFTEPNGGNLISPDYVVTEDIVLYAHWATSVNARQRYPWNGLVDIVVTFQGASNDVAETECLFAAIDYASKSAILVEHITQNGDDVVAGNVTKRKYIWNAVADVGAVKIDDVALSVNARIPDYVQLWKDGPYWAKCNVGATKPEECGYYFRWGDTVGGMRDANNTGWISVNDSTGFLFAPESYPLMETGNPLLQHKGYIDSTGNLVATHDVAAVHLGAPWRMPTDAEFSALISNCTTTWTTRNGVNGRLVTGKGAYSTKSIFLPAAGVGFDSDLCDLGSCGAYRSSTPNSVYISDAWGLIFDSDNFERSGYSYRCEGESVRPVRDFATKISLTDGGWITHLSLDCRVGAKVVDGTHPLVYDAAWYAGGVTAKITANGQEIVSGTAGSYAWKPSSDGAYLLTLNVYNALGVVVGTESVWVDGVTGSGEVNNYTDAVVGKEVTGLEEPVTVPATWVTDFLVQHYGTGKVDAFRQLYGGDLAGALAKPTGKQGISGEVRTVWDDYVAGTDPTDPASVFTTTIAIIDGKVVLDWSPNLNLGSVNRLYRVKSKLKLSDAWTCPPVTGHHFFMTEVALPDGKTQTASPGVIGDASPDGGGGADKLAHRWSFNGNLNDSVGNRTATAIGSVSSDGLTYTLSGDYSTVAYIDLGTGLFADGVTEFTIETWVTPYATGWRRIWDMADQFGQCWNGKENLMGVRDHISWTSYATNVKTYIAVVCAALPSGGWSLVYYHLDPETGATLSSYASTTVGSDWSPQKVGVNALLLGKSNAPQDPYGNASYDEFRIWNRALSEDELKKSVEKGPNQLP